MSEAIYLILGLAVGAALGVLAGRLWGRRAVESDLARASGSLDEVRTILAQRDHDLRELRAVHELEQKTGAESRARLEAAREHFAEQRKQIEELEKKAKEAFAALSVKALEDSNKQFLTLAETRFKPIREQLERYELHVKQLEKARQEAYGGLTEKLQSLQERSDRLSSETSQLVAALRHSGAKGKWGEVTLQRIVELCGLSEHCDFTLQAHLDSGQKPDLLVRLPGGRTLAVDSKVNASAYLDAMNATDDVLRKQHLARFAADVRNTLKTLAAKEYWRALSPAPEFVVMFMPGEAFFAAALSQDNELLTDGVGQGVLLASPTTLIALLYAVRHGWQQQQVAENAERIAEAGRDLYDRLCNFVSHLEKVRAGIKRSVDSFNEAVGSWTSRTEPAARRLKELGAADASRELPDLEPIDQPLRALPESSDTDSPEARRAG